MSNKINKAVSEVIDIQLSNKQDSNFYERLAEQDYEERIININDVISDWVVDDVVMPIIRYNAEDKDKPIEERKPIKIYINTDGGYVDACQLVLNAIENSETPVHTYVLGRAFSAGALILIAGHKRFASKNAMVLIHEGHSGAYGVASKAYDIVDFQKRHRERIKNMIISKTKISEELYEEKYRDEWFLFGDEALELGIVDELLK